MTDRASLLLLRDRLKAATGPDRELDYQIAGALWSHARGNSSDWADGFKDGIPRYTASIDDAVTLVPKGCSWDVRFRSHWNCAVNVGEDWATRHPDKHSAHIWRMANRGLYDIHEHGEAATPAVALCLARVEYEIERLPT